MHEKFGVGMGLFGVMTGVYNTRPGIQYLSGQIKVKFVNIVAWPNKAGQVCIRRQTASFFF